MSFLDRVEQAYDRMTAAARQRECNRENFGRTYVCLFIPDRRHVRAECDAIAHAQSWHGGRPCTCLPTADTLKGELTR